MKDNLRRSRARDGRLLGVAVMGLMTVALAGQSAAQTPPAGKPATPPEMMEPPSENPVPNTKPDAPEGPLSKQLKEGEGVLEPPRGVDPEIQKPVPDEFEGRTPVVPPPADGKDIEPE